MDTYFQDANGRVVCPDHIGNYGRMALEKKPDVKRIQTPITVWIRLNEADIEEVKEFNSHICETCDRDSRQMAGRK